MPDRPAIERTEVPDDPAAALGSLDLLQAGLTAGRWTPVDVVDAAVERRARSQAAAWIDLVPAAALRAAAERLTAEGPAGRPLWGVPFAVKGNIDVAGLPTTAACPGFARGPAADHAEVVARLVAAGALPVGTTNLDQFATGLVGTRSPYGAPHAAGRPGWVSGGSSSGSAVVVAEGAVPLALATDTAGSGRVPAALNGIAALKPTRGRISTRGVVPACRSLDCVALFAATPGAAAAVASIVAGHDPSDVWSRPDRPVAEGAEGGWWRPRRRPPRIGVLPEGDPADLAPRWFAGDLAAARAHADAGTRLAALGWQLVEVDVTPLLEAGELLYGGAFVAERFTAVGQAVQAGVAGLDPVVASIIRHAGEVPAWRAFADVDRLRRLRQATRPLWDDVDALALPVVPTTFTQAAVADDPVGTNQLLGTYTSFGNLLDLCAAVAPTGHRADGHPWAVQLLAPAFHDGVVAALAHDLAVGAAGGAGAASPRALPARPAHRHQGAPRSGGGDGSPPGGVPLAVAGAHLRGEPLAHEIEACGGRWIGTTCTAPRYRLLLVVTDPPRPGLVRVDADGSGAGAAIEVDVWALPPEGWARFVGRGVPNLAVGQVELTDGTTCAGFVAARRRSARRPRPHALRRLARLAPRRLAGLTAAPGRRLRS